MSFYRVANAQYQISSKMPSARVVFRTEDTGLEGMHLSEDSSSWGM